MYFNESNFIKCIPKKFCSNESIKGLIFPWQTYVIIKNNK